MKIRNILMVAAAAFILTTNVNAQAPTPKIIKIATLAPDGTTLAKGLNAMKDEVKAKTNGSVDFQIYFGGSQGDEKTIVEKIAVGQLHGGALTGVGLGKIEPEIRVLELPFLFKSYNQADYVYGQLRSYFEDKFLKKNFVLLGWAEVGFVKIFSNKPITSKADLTGMKMWIWEGDKLAEAMYEAMGIVPVPLPITGVLTGLAQGTIDGCYAPELGAIAFQWNTKVKNMTDVNLVDGTGALIIAKAEWDKLTPDEQKIVREVVDAQLKKLVAQSRIDNQASQEVLKSNGISIVQLTPEALAELQTISKGVQTKLVGVLYPQALLDKVNQLISSAPQ